MSTAAVQFTLVDGRHGRVAPELRQRRAVVVDHEWQSPSNAIAPAYGWSADRFAWVVSVGLVPSIGTFWKNVPPFSRW